MEYLPVTVDKSHLITIGERLYSESIELIRELVNNAYDADAKQVDIKMTDEFIEVKDKCFAEGTVIYINQQHPLYQREAKKPETYILNVTRLITQEISLMKDTKNPRQAFSRQSKLLRDAFIENSPS